MDLQTLHLKELSLIRAAQELRSPFMDQFMHVLNLLDTLPFYVFAITLILFSYKQNLGFRLLYLLFISSFINQDAKELLAQPRPCQLDSALCMIFAKSHGLPSGAAQTMFVLFGYMSYHLRNKFFTIFSVFFILLIGFSRVYLGLHFVTDLLGGWFLGAILLTGYIYLLPRVMRYIQKQSKTTLVILFSLGAGFFSFLALNKNTSLTVMACFGVSIGLIYTHLSRDPQNLKERIFRPLVALSGVTMLLLLTLLLPDSSYSFLSIISKLCQFLAGLWMSLGAISSINYLERRFFKT